MEKRARGRSIAHVSRTNQQLVFQADNFERFEYYLIGSEVKLQDMMIPIEDRYE